MEFRDSAHSDYTLPGTRSKSPDWWLFLSKFLKQGRGVASVAPSSKYMARSILKGIDFDKAKCVVELGAGTGPITAEILKRCPPTCRPLFLELDHDMAQRLRERFPAAEVVEGDAADLCEILSARGIDRVDAIVSGLPIPSIPDEIRHRILKSCSRALALGGHFRQLTVMPWIYYSMYRSYFEQVRFRFVPLNLPPGGWYDCQGYRR